MVKAIRRRVSFRRVAEEFGVARSTVEWWVNHAKGKRLDRVDWTDRPSGARVAANRVDGGVETCVIRMREQLKESDLGEFGPDAILREMEKLGCANRPSRATIHRILERHGALDGCRRKRFPPPPPGWYLPGADAKNAELDSFDYIEDLHIHGGEVFHILNAVSLRGGLVGSWPVKRMTSENTVRNALSHWREFGLPDYAQFDNGAAFFGSHWADSLGKVSRLCLSLGVTPIFAPPHEMGFQAAIENFNGRWETGVWHRFEFHNLQEIETQSARFVAANREKLSARIAAAPSRWLIEKSWKLDYQAPPVGTVIFIRRLDDAGCVEVMGHRWLVSPDGANRLVRAEVDLTEHIIRFYRLRRRTPHHHAYLGYVDYTFPERKFKEN